MTLIHEVIPKLTAIKVTRSYNKELKGKEICDTKNTLPAIITSSEVQINPIITSPSYISQHRIITYWISVSTQLKSYAELVEDLKSLKYVPSAQSSQINSRIKIVDWGWERYPYSPAPFWRDKQSIVEQININQNWWISISTIQLVCGCPPNLQNSPKNKFQVLDSM